MSHPFMHPEVFRSFISVAECRSFTAAATRLGLAQSTVSQHILKLEERVGRRLFQRDTHFVALTEDGNAMLGLATAIVATNENLFDFFAGTANRTRLRLGISEDFAMSRLSQVLAEFRREEPRVDIELTVGLSGHLYQLYDSGYLDVIFAKRKPGDNRGIAAWCERLVWIANTGFHWNSGSYVPLVVYPPPSITRTLAIKGLDEANLPWRITCCSSSLNGLKAAISAGLGVSVFAETLAPEHLIVVGQGVLPELPSIDFVILAGVSNSETDRLSKILIRSANEAISGLSDMREPA